MKKNKKNKKVLKLFYCLKSCSFFFGLEFDSENESRDLAYFYSCLVERM